VFRLKYGQPATKYTVYRPKPECAPEPHEGRKTPLKTYRSIALAAAVLSTLFPVFVSNTAAAQEPAPCDVRLVVELTPDVPDPTDAGFLSSLLSNQVGYQLSVRQERSDSLLVLELTGPGPYYLCQNVIDTIRRDGRVLFVHVDKRRS
jgi:hypothetical protein